MTIYKVFYKIPKLRRGEFLGVLPERSQNLRGEGQIESATKWARSVFGNLLRRERTIFVIPKEY